MSKQEEIKQALAAAEEECERLDQELTDARLMLESLAEDKKILLERQDGKDSTIDTLTKQITDEVAISAAAIVERDRLHKELDACATLIEQQGRAMNRLQNMTNKQLLEIHRLRIELEEARKTKFPRQHDSEGGWTIDYKLLERLGVAVLRESDYSVDTEDIEQVLLALEKVLGQEGEGNQDEQRT